MRDLFLAALVTAQASAFLNTNAGGKLFICTTPQPTDLDATAYAGLTWVQIKGVGNHGETGSKTNILNYNTWDTDVIQKGKGTTDAGSPSIEVGRLATDAGQVALRAAALTNYNYAFKIERNDKPNTNVGSKPTTIYNRGLVTGPTHPNGRNEDFDLEIFTLALNQREIVVEAVTA
jgi:hypothetical protein